MSGNSNQNGAEATGTTEQRKPASAVVPNESKRQNKITLNIVVKETNRKLCTFFVNETDTLSKVKDVILRKNKNVVVNNLFIKEE